MLTEKIWHFLQISSATFLPNIINIGFQFHIESHRGELFLKLKHSLALSGLENCFEITSIFKGLKAFKIKTYSWIHILGLNVFKISCAINAYCS